MFLKRQFTIMVIPDAQARLRRFKLRGSQIAWAGTALALVTVLAVTAPFAYVWARGLSGKVTQLEEERERMTARSADVESTLSDVRKRLDQFEQRTQQLATVAGLNLPSLGPSGQGLSADVEGLVITERIDLLNDEANELSDRSALLERRLGTVEQVVDEQSDRLSRRPSILPVRGLIGSGFGWRRDPFTGRRQFHKGLDISAPDGTPVRSPADGIVIKTERHSGYGRVLYISHGDGVMTRFGHLSEFKKRPGDKIHRGEIIALVGNTGRSTAPHLHYEVLEEGAQVDPMRHVVDESLFY